MERNMRYLIIVGIVVLGMLLTCTSSAIAAYPTITVSPEKPSRKSTVTLTAEFDVDVMNVYLRYNECYSGGCYSIHNESMISIGDNKFEADITLVKDNTIYIQYWLEYETVDGWSSTEDEFEETYLATGSSGDSNDTPGFELLLVALSIMFVAFIFKRKRIK